MSLERFWAIHRVAHLFTMWLASIMFALLGGFLLLCGLQRPLLFLFALPCVALAAIVNPWIVRRYQRSRG